MAQIGHAARWGWVKYVDNTYKSVGTESYNFCLFYGEKIKTIQKLGLRGNHFFPGHLKAWVAAQTILIVQLNLVCSQGDKGF